MKVLDDLFELQDKKYAEFHNRLMPTLPKEAMAFFAAKKGDW